MNYTGIHLSENDSRTLIERITGIDKTTLPEISTSVSFEPETRNTLLGIAGIMATSIVIAALIKSKTK